MTTKCDLCLRGQHGMMLQASGFTVCVLCSIEALRTLSLTRGMFAPKPASPIDWSKMEYPKKPEEAFRVPPVPESVADAVAINHCNWCRSPSAKPKYGICGPCYEGAVLRNYAPTPPLPKSLRGVTLAIDRQTVDALTLRVIELERETEKLTKERDEDRERRKWFDLMWRAAESRANLAEHNHETAAKQRSDAWAEIEELKMKLKDTP